MTPPISRQALVRLLQVAVALSLSVLHLSARADLWAYADEQGVTHFAAEQVDDRYTLFFKGSDVGDLGSPDEVGAASRSRGNSGDPAFVLPRRFADLDSSKGYRAAQKHMQAAAKAHAVDYELLKAVIAAESGFDSAAVSSKGAVGLMQLLPTTAEQYGVVADKRSRRDEKGKLLPARTVEQKLTDPQTNIQAGARYLAYLIKLFKGELSLALAAYNAGEGAVQRAGNRIPNYKETQGYVKTVMGLYELFKPAATAPNATGPLGGRIGSRMGGRVRVELGGLPQIPADTP